jgi:molybdenum cofactor cytidylyltransferase
MDAVLLAAGYSSRAGDFKLSWPIEGVPLLVRQTTLFSTCCDRIYVVGGHWIDQVKDLVKGISSVQVVENPHYQEGMFSSVQAGVARVKGDFFICPSDYPGIAPVTLTELAESPGPISIPTYRGKKGHPLFMKSKYRDIVLHEEKSSNLRNIIAREGFLPVPVDDRGILYDIDTLDDYRRYVEESW